MKLTKANPLFPGFFADPDMLKWRDIYYIYPTTDGFQKWEGTQFPAFSSKDLANWKNEGILLDVATEEVPWSINCAWAPAIHEKDGKFYFYFCAKRKDKRSCIGVAVSDHPTKGFIAKKQPILTPEIVAKQGLLFVENIIDPSIYEENGKTYLLFGNTVPLIVELNEELTDILPETMRKLEGAQYLSEAISVFKRNGIYHFTYSSDDARSENYHIEYGTSSSLFGPIEYQYPILMKDPARDILGTGHHCIFKEPDKDQYYIAYHRFATPTKVYEGCGFRREICLDLLEFDAQGRIKPIEKH